MSRKNQPPKSVSAGIGVLDRSDTPQPEQLSVARAAISVPLTQPRRYFEPTKMQQLIVSIKTHGILENLLVRPIPGKDGLYELIAGEKRFRAAMAAGLDTVPVTIIHDLSDEQALALALSENLHRDDLNPVEETEGILQLLALRLSLPVKEVPLLLYRLQKEAKGQRVSHSVMGQPEEEIVKGVFACVGRMSVDSFTNNRLPLLNLPDDILEALRSGKIAYTKAVVIAQIDSPSKRQELLKLAIANNLSLCQVRQQVKALKPPALKALLPSRLEAAYKQVKKFKVWENPAKCSELESLLAQLEALVGIVR